MTSKSKNNDRGIRLLQKMLQAASNPTTLISYIAALETPDEFPAVNDMTDHFCSTAMFDISIRNDDSTSPAEMELNGAVNILNAVSVANIVEWAHRQPDEAAAVELTVHERTAPHQTNTERQFSHTNRVQNVEAVKKSIGEWYKHPAPNIQHLPPTVIGTMNAVRHSCHKELQLAEGTIPECEGYIYEPDDHFSAFITYAFITTLLETHEA